METQWRMSEPVLGEEPLSETLSIRYWYWYCIVYLVPLTCSHTQPSVTLYNGNQITVALFTFILAGVDQCSDPGSVHWGQYFKVPSNFFVHCLSVVRLWLWLFPENAFVPHCLKTTDMLLLFSVQALGCEVLLDRCMRKKAKLVTPKKKGVSKEKGRGHLCRRILVKSLSKILLFFWRRDIHRGW